MTVPVVLITGASRGIGFAAAKELATRGATVIVASRELARAEKAAREIGAPAEALQLDITDSSRKTRGAGLLECTPVAKWDGNEASSCYGATF